MRSAIFSKETHGAPIVGAAANMQQSYFGKLIEKIKLRFKEASEAFTERMAWETKSLTQPQSSAQPVSLNLAGYLFSIDGDKPLNIYEGMNRWLMTSDQKIQIVPGIQADTNQENIISLEYDFLQVYEKGSTAKRMTLSTNECVRLGNKNFFIKILPKKYRLKMDVKV